VRARRGSQIATVAVARKLAVLAWHLLTSGSEYRWAPPSLTAAKLRRAQLKAGAARQRGGRSATSSVSSRDLRRQQERRVLEQAEEAYRTLVASRDVKKDAVVARGSDWLA
jgi:predicted GTPase